MIFYAQTDWLRLATALAANASPCAEYYISIPPLASDKSQPRPGQASLIRALGPNMHALAEINYAGWSSWVQANGSDWFAAGVTARQRLAAAGYDVNAGDTWAVNEATSAVRRNTGAARQNLTEFLHGLEDGGGRPAKGVVFAIGVGQQGDQTAYHITMQSWLEDSGFWTTVGNYVSDWMQEVYGDVRSYAVIGASPQQRRDALAQYLGHPLALATAGGSASAAARSFFASAYGPLANAAWAWPSSYGWTQVPYDVMEDYVSAQTYASRSLDAFAGLPADRFGAAWAPANTQELAPADFAAQTAAILGRLGRAIRDSAENVDPADPGIAACGPSGQDLWCRATLPGAALNPAWSAFSTWAASGATFASPPVTMTAGSVAGPLTVQLQTAGIATNTAAPQQVTLSSSSPNGTFAAGPTGPWLPTETLTIPAGASSITFYYQDTLAGTPTLSAAIAGQPPAVQNETVAPAAPATLTVTPRTADVKGGTTLLFTATVADAYANSTDVPVHWTLASDKLGSVSPDSGPSTTFTGTRSAAGRTRLTATAAGLSGSAGIVVRRPPARIGGTLLRRISGHVVVTVWVVNGLARARGIPLTLTVRRGSSLVASVTGRTDHQGRFVWRSRHRLPAARYRVKATLQSHT